MACNKFLIGFLMLVLSGCATGGRNAALEIENLKNQILVLQTESEASAQQVAQLQQIISNNEKEKASLSTQISMLSGKVKPVALIGSIKQIQIALKNAGYDSGNLDGKMGGKTRKAIKDFQKDNLLPVTGKVDKETWFKLRGFLPGNLK